MHAAAEEKHSLTSRDIARASRILMADDDPLMREFAATHLSHSVLDITTAQDGLEAWNQLKSRPFDLALLDLDMPRLGGLELIGRIRQDPTLSHLPVVVVTGREDMFAIDRAYELGATSFVTKPVNWRLLTHELRYILRMSAMEQDLRAARDRAQEAIAVRDNMLKIMRHETRTPLNAIIGFSELIEREVHGAIGREDYRTYATHIREAGERLFGTLSEMLLLAQLLSGEADVNLDDYPLDVILTEAAAQAEPKARLASIDIHIQGANEDAVLNCDKRLIIFALRHLIENAILYGASGRVVTVAGRQTLQGETMIEVRDRGPGMSAEEIKRAFEPFYQSDMSLSRSKGGLGLGLPTVHVIVERHGGQVALSSVPNEGTTARIVLPGNRVPR